MRTLDELYQYVNDSTMILVINNNSKSLLDAIFNRLYNKYVAPKCKCTTSKGLMLKLSKIKNKLIRHEFDLKKIQFSSSNTNSKIRNSFNDLQLFLMENNSKILLKLDISSYKYDSDDKFDIRTERFLYGVIPQYDIFNLIIFIDKKNIKIIKYQTDKKHFNMFNSYGFKEKYIFNIDSLIRNTKLKKIKLLSNKES